MARSLRRASCGWSWCVRWSAGTGGRGVRRAWSTVTSGCSATRIPRFRPSPGAYGTPPPFDVVDAEVRWIEPEARAAQVLLLIADGATPHGVSDLLFISAKTADNHIQHIYRRHHARSAGAVMMAR